MFIPPSSPRHLHGRRHLSREQRKAVVIPVAITAVIGAMTATFTSSAHHARTHETAVPWVALGVLAVVMGWAIARAIGRCGKI